VFVLTQLASHSVHGPQSPSEQIGSRLDFKDLLDLQHKANLIQDGRYVDSN
jgi:hypothetical protein